MPTLTDKQAPDFLSRLFPNGLGDPGLLAELCPEGWKASPLRLTFHPTDEQRYEERKKEDEEDRKQQEAMARDLAAAKRRALDEAPPATVLAYQEVYGKDPHHWPPDPDSPD